MTSIDGVVILGDKNSNAEARNTLNKRHPSYTSALVEVSRSLGSLP